MSLTELTTEITYTAVCDGCGEDEEVTVDIRFDDDPEQAAVDHLAEYYDWRHAGPVGAEVLICADCAVAHPVLRDCDPGEHSWLPISTDGVTTVLGCTWCRIKAVHAPLPDAAAPGAPKTAPERTPVLTAETDPFDRVPTLLETAAEAGAFGRCAHALLREGAWGSDVAGQWGRPVQYVRVMWLAWAVAEADRRGPEAHGELEEAAERLGLDEDDLPWTRNSADPDREDSADAARWSPAQNGGHTQ